MWHNRMCRFAEPTVSSIVLSIVLISLCNADIYILLETCLGSFCNVRFRPPVCSPKTLTHVSIAFLWGEYSWCQCHYLLLFVVFRLPAVEAIISLQRNYNFLLSITEGLDYFYYHH